MPLNPALRAALNATGSDSLTDEEKVALIGEVADQNPEAAVAEIAGS